eukprot:TRINITY_DN1513_c0_g1_i4.p2 TRINITY_DN1513_c0_g1~~TRINITY_DN1513_c0_g1_i4.p2  ORF type:complete len:318 (+),score=113.55 TRINITY_DN1513_c0_g1_i4:765-1718(+)
MFAAAKPQVFRSLALRTVAVEGAVGASPADEALEMIGAPRPACQDAATQEEPEREAEEEVDVVDAPAQPPHDLPPIGALLSGSFGAGILQEEAAAEAEAEAAAGEAPLEARPAAPAAAPAPAAKARPAVVAPPVDLTRFAPKSAVLSEASPPRPACVVVSPTADLPLPAEGGAAAARVPSALDLPEGHAHPLVAALSAQLTASFDELLTRRLQPFEARLAALEALVAGRAPASPPARAGPPRQGRDVMSRSPPRAMGSGDADKLRALREERERNNARYNAEAAQALYRFNSFEVRDSPTGPSPKSSPRRSPRQSPRQ